MEGKACEMEEGKVHVGDVDINFLRVGTGDHPVLLMAGVLGTTRISFRLQIEKLNREKLTIVVWDPPGYGQSRPPDRTFPDNFHQRDAAWAHSLMKSLGYSKFSLLGWCDGGTVALLLAATYPDSIRKMIVLGARSYVRSKEIQVFESLRDINTWSERLITDLLQVYNMDYIQKIVSEWIEYMLRVYIKQDGDLCKQTLPKIKCQTFIIHGEKDALAVLEQSKYLKQNIVDSKLYIFENGKHNPNQKYPEKFNKLITDFLLGE
ncbi:hypothetical protein DMN91_002576 [Ooceraea biroi]|uniref:AB hydrolase-1 domain-containing protein n=1 Tax=Ooceraea biroi TaxID=2015173 RepID=A0A3L8DVL9_OOCBI|nr:valacyclovir hydrolase [Ooceraea biroi]XP_011334152.1 valacyclovir hydrolase [Ooceraea biroi]XP_011334154.1 valacyclovir hydrolase [Ooceraea biroi]XP_011334156.1 valacyclovir hydrolase [Ooceraea biroi]XP_011334157.1 valacyclovir hydrolase [Ooceraea biroi]XP_019886621.1 valacyclovir hydrolase [Ooceraea biroi]RLU24487.1 hypothetical protein DMN91_002576 [Ooceraea biroi]